MIFRRASSPADGTRKRLSTPFLVSVGVHLIVAVALMQMLILNGDFSRPKRQPADEQHVGFVRIAKGGVKNPIAGKVGGDG
jgi:hypothetical protein